MIDVHVARSAAGGPVNEDVAGAFGDAAWVIDGATGLLDGVTGHHTDAAWLARTVDRALRLALADSPRAAASALFARVIDDCAGEFERVRIRPVDDRAQRPSAAIMLARFDGTTIEFASLGDCEAIYSVDGGEARCFAPDGLAPFERRTMAALREALSGSDRSGHSATRTALLPTLLDNRRRMNMPGGYWVLGLDREAALHIDTRVVEVTSHAEVALATDGFIRAVRPFGLVHADEVPRIRDEAAFDAVVARLRADERRPTSRAVHPRVKACDDATLIVFGCTKGDYQ